MTDDPAETIAEIRAAEDLPREADRLVFDAPWQARAFGLVVSLYRDGVFEWNEFQQRLVDAVESDDVDDAGTDREEIYYRQWITAFETLLLDEGIVVPDELRRRADEFETGERDASEFVVGASGHGNDHDHSHSH